MREHNRATQRRTQPLRFAHASNAGSPRNVPPKDKRSSPPRVIESVNGSSSAQRCVATNTAAASLRPDCDPASGAAHDRLFESALNTSGSNAEYGPAILQDTRVEGARSSLAEEKPMEMKTERVALRSQEYNPVLPHPHSLNPHTWHFTHPSAYSICDPQSGQVPMKVSAE